MKSILVASVLALGLAACGSESGSGVDGSKKLSEISAAEKRSLCEWYLAEVGGVPGEKMCSENVTATVQTVQECVDDDIGTSSCVVSQLEDCASSLNGDPCGLLEARPAGLISPVHSLRSDDSTLGTLQGLRVTAITGET